VKIALVHDWLTGMRGGEKVLREIADLCPAADLFTLLHVRDTCGEITRGRRVTASWLNRLPAIGRYYRYLLPVMPLAIESLDLAGHDLVISTSHCVAKAVRKPPGAVHVCYCHSPMRYVWDQERSYRGTMGPAGMGLRLLGSSLRRWDVRTAGRVDHFLANSHNVAGRIRRVYGRDSAVIHPPVDTEFYCPDPAVEREDFYLMVTALAPYKRVDQAIEAFRELPDRRLVILGAGQQDKALRGQAGGNVTFLGWASDEAIRDHCRKCRALLFPGEEDFGIVPVEAMACGAAVIAFDAGGAMETVRNALDPTVAAQTGLRYRHQTPQGLRQAINRFEALSPPLDPAHAVAHARTFSRDTFRSRFRAFLRGIGA